MTKVDDSCSLSIIIVNWNTREMTLECLRSLYAETRETAFEVLLVDNGSHDGSAEVVAKEFPQVRLFVEPVNQGFAKANNIAALEAKGDHLLLLNSDTLVLDGAIDKLMAFARRTPDAQIWGGRTLFGERTLNCGSAWGKISTWSTFSFAIGLLHLAPNTGFFNPEGLGGWDRASERRVDIVSGCFFLITAALWRRLGGFDSVFFMYGEEADLCARARAMGAEPRCTPEATIVHYGGASSSHQAGKIIYLFGAKIGLMRRHMTPGRGGLARLTMIFAAWWRATLFGLANRIRPGRYEGPARAWGEAWARRAEWRDGPLRQAVSLSDTH